MFSKLENLRSHISTTNQLIVYNADISWTVTFKWNPLLDKNDMSKSLQDFTVPLPQDYLDFLVNISNGAILFYEMKYGQGGVHLYSLHELIENREKWVDGFLSDSSRYVVFAELIGETLPFIFDTLKPNDDNTSFEIIAGDLFLPINENDVIGNSFIEWLDLIIDSRGEKYWE